MEYPLPPVDQIKPSWTESDHVYKVVFGLNKTHIEWAFGLNIFGLILCVITIVLVLCLFRRPSFRGRPSFRLSASIAFYNMLCMVIGIVMWSAYGSILRSDEIVIRALFFIKSFGLSGFVFSVTMMAVHINLTIITDKNRLVRILKPYYEIIIFVLALVDSQPEFYIHQAVQGYPEAGVIVSVEESWGKMRFQLFMMYSWMLLGIAYCLVISIIVIWKLISLWRNVKVLTPRFPEGVQSQSTSAMYPRSDINDNDDDYEPISSILPHRLSEMDPRMYLTQMESSYNFQQSNSPNKPNFDVSDQGQPQIPSEKDNGVDLCMRAGFSPARSVNTQLPYNSYDQSVTKIKTKSRRSIVLAIFRIAINPITPLLVTPIVPIYMCVGNPSDDLRRIYYYIPFINTVTNFLIFMVNPCFDKAWKRIYQWFYTIFRPLRQYLRAIWPFWSSPSPPSQPPLSPPLPKSTQRPSVQFQNPECSPCTISQSPQTLAGSDVFTNEEFVPKSKSNHRVIL